MSSRQIMASRRLRRAGRFVVGALMLGVCASLAGCPVIGYVASAVTPEKQKVHVNAQYLGLANKTVAVIVAMPEQAKARYPDAPSLLARSISRGIKESIPGAEVVNPDQLVNWLQENPYWATLSYRELIKQINVDRIVLIDIGEYGMYEPGNMHVMQGVIVANVGVVEDREDQPQDLGESMAFLLPIDVRYPDNQIIGEVNSDEQTMEFATVSKFARTVTWLFYDHVEEHDR